MNQRLPVSYINHTQRPTDGIWSSETLLPNSVPCTLQRRGATKASHPRGQIRRLQAKKPNSSASSHQSRSKALAPIPYAHKHSPSPPRLAEPVMEPYEDPKAPTPCKRLYLSLTNEYAPSFVKNAQKRVFVEKGPLDPTSTSDETTQMYRYLLDILAFTLGVDCHMLSRALGQKFCTSTTTILGIQERQDLRQLSLAVQRLHSRELKNQHKSMLLADKDRVLQKIMRPMAETGFQAFVLDLIASYADHRGDPTKWQNTSLGYWSKKRGKRQYLSYHIDYFVNRKTVGGFDPMNWRSRKMEAWSRRRKVVQCLASHMKLLSLIEPSGKVKLVFEQAIGRYQVERGLKIWSLAGLEQGIFELAIREGFVPLRMALQTNKSKV